MDTEVAEFIQAHGKLLIFAVIALAAIAMVQWRKARAMDLELAFKRELLEQGASASEIESIIKARLPHRRGLLDQFGALSGGAKTGLIVGFVVTAIVTVSVLASIVQSYVFWSSVRQHERASPVPMTPPSGQQPKLTLMPERPELTIAAEGSGSCRVYLIDGYSPYDLQLIPVIKEQDNSQSELHVQAVPSSIPRSEAKGQRACEIKVQAIRGTGRFVIQVSAADQYRCQAQTTFVVRVAEK